MKSLSSLAFSLLAIAQVSALRSPHQHSSFRAQALQMQSEGPSIQRFNAQLRGLTRALPAALGALVVLSGYPADAQAASSGGRSGGSSFRSAPSRSSSSYSRPATRLNSNAYSYSAPVMPVRPIMPMPFYPSPFFFPSPFVVLGGGPVSFLFNTLLLAALASALFNLLQRTGGQSFRRDGEAGGVGALGAGATVLKLQVSLDEDWASSSNIMTSLSYLASRQGALGERAPLASLLSDASLALLRRQGDWSAASLSGEKFNALNAEKAEGAFQRMAVSERAKFEREALLSMDRPPSSSAGVTRPTQAVVSLLVAVRGQSEALRRVGGAGDVQQALQALAAEALLEEGENILAVELLWTPSEPGDVLSKRQLVLDYPELMAL